jgi:hypothetical protein
MDKVRENKVLLHVFVSIIKFNYPSIKVSCNYPTIEGMTKLIKSDLYQIFCKKDVTITYDKMHSVKDNMVFEVFDHHMGSSEFINVKIEKKCLLEF